MPNENMDVNYVANLARIQLTDLEVSRFSTQLNQMMSFAESLSEVDVSEVEPTAHATPIFDRIREDEVKPGMTQEDFLWNAPEVSGNQLKVPKIIE